MSDPEAVDYEAEDVEDTPSEEEEEVDDRRERRRWIPLLALILLLLLLCCCASTTVDMLVTRGPEQARFVARNLQCLQCHTELIPEFSKTTVHSPFMQRDCTVCHTKHGGQLTVTVTQGASKQVARYRTLFQWLPLKWWFDLWGAFTGGSAVGSSGGSSGGVVSKSVTNVNGTKSELVMPEDKLCWMCHGDMGAMLDDAYQHVPFEKGRCTECHNPHASDYRGLLKVAPNKICFTCHPMGKELGRMQPHPPANQGWCTDCHNPHASNYKGILNLSQRELCFTCHPSVASLSGMPTQHQPFNNQNCTACHEAHGSDSTPLLKKPQPALCYDCHPQIKNQFTQPSHHPIGLELTCSSCHNPHAALYPGLLDDTNNDFCYDCHGDVQKQYEADGHVVNKCVRCHTPHGSKYSPMLVDKMPDLCLQCHPNFAGDNQHPVKPKYYDVRAHKGLTCASTCHNPHGSDFPAMLRNYDWRHDGICLQCHKTVGVYY